MRREEDHVPDPIPERRQLDAAHRDAMKQVVAEAPLLHRPIEIAPGRRDDAHVDPDPALAAEPADLAALERAEELGLEREIEIADLVDEQRAAARLLEDAAARGDRARENAPRSWPKSSASICDGAVAAQSKTTNGAAARPPASCSASASTSLPVPVSPSMTTATSLFASLVQSG